MFNKTIKKLAVSWHKKYMEGMVQVTEQYKQLQDVEYLWDIPFKSQDGTSLAMDLFRPKNNDALPYPVVIMVHGGGLLMGDRRMEMGICRHFAQAGFLAASVEYRVFPEVDIRGAVMDLAGGMEEIGSTIAGYGGDPQHIYLVAESAGVFAAILVLSMSGSERLRNAIGGRVTGIHIRAMAALSGMYYVNRGDLVGIAMKNNVIPKDTKTEKITELMNLERDEIIDCLPPILMVSSKGDFLRKYTLRYADFLKEQKKEYRLVYYDKAKHLYHAFPSLAPEVPESIAVDQMIVSWFYEHADK